METLDVTQHGIMIDVGPWQRRDRWRVSSTLTLWVNEEVPPLWLSLILDTRQNLGPVEWYASQNTTRLRLSIPPWVRYAGKRSWVTALSGYSGPLSGYEHLDETSFFYVPLAFDPHTKATPPCLRARREADGIAYQVSWDEDPLAI